MNLKKRNLVTIDDLSNAEIMAIFNLASEMEKDIKGQFNLCQGLVMASLFFEPSTRTRLSFESAMHRLGGNVITVSEMGGSSLAKGESIADTARIVGSYADVIVVRHPWEGAARVVADYAGVPVINAGDGGHQHPTQTLCDLYTLVKERNTIKGLKIALWGDLKYGRTTHSLIFALARFGADILFCPSPGLGVPDHIIEKLVREYGGEVQKVTGSMQDEDGNIFPVDALYTPPSRSHQLAMLPDVNIEIELREGVDALYVTRPQKERFDAGETERDINAGYRVVNKQLLGGRPFRKSLVMHPLPRVDELAVDIDSDERSAYFKQAARGVPVRMALLALMLGVRDVPLPDVESPPPVEYPYYSQRPVPACNNPRCVTRQSSEAKYLEPKYKIVNLEPLTLRCIYCEHGMEPKYIASIEGHDTKTDGKKYHAASSHWVKNIKPENLIVFNSEAEAQALGFKPSHYTRGNY